MNWCRCLQILVQTRKDRFLSRLSRFASALKTSLLQPSESRRLPAGGHCQIEALEVREVLSVPNPLSVSSLSIATAATQSVAIDSGDPQQVKITAAAPGIHEHGQVSQPQADQVLLPVADHPAVPRSDGRAPIPGVSNQTDSEFAVADDMVIDTVFQETTKILDRSLASAPTSPLAVFKQGYAPASAFSIAVESVVEFSADTEVATIPPSTGSLKEMSADTAKTRDHVSPTTFGDIRVSPDVAESETESTQQRSLTISGRLARTGTSVTEVAAVIPVSDLIRRRAESRGLFRPAGHHTLSLQQSLFATQTHGETLPVSLPLEYRRVSHEESQQPSWKIDPTVVGNSRPHHRLSSVPHKLETLRPPGEDDTRHDNTEDVPRQLNYVVQARGPPRRPPEIILRIMEPDVEADVLQRLRYSIAPREPSPVTVMMQLPGNRSFSGPGMSPDENRVSALAC